MASPGCSTSPPTPGHILHDANLDEAEPFRTEAISNRSRFSVGKAVDTAFCFRPSLSVTNSASKSYPDISFHKAKSHTAASYPFTADGTSDAEDERHTRLIVLDSPKIQVATECPVLFVKEAIRPP
jgi:hypothetical protein